MDLPTTTRKEQAMATYMETGVTVEEALQMWEAYKVTPQGQKDKKNHTEFQLMMAHMKQVIPGFE